MTKSHLDTFTWCTIAWSPDFGSWYNPNGNTRQKEPRHYSLQDVNMEQWRCYLGLLQTITNSYPPWSPVHCSRGDCRLERRATCYPGIMALRSQEWSGGGHAMLTQHRRFPQFDISMGTGKWAEKMPQFRADAEFFIRRVWHLTNNAEFMEYNSNVQEQAIRTFLCEHIKT